MTRLRVHKYSKLEIFLDYFINKSSKHRLLYFKDFPIYVLDVGLNFLFFYKKTRTLKTKQKTFDIVTWNSNKLPGT